MNWPNGKAAWQLVRFTVSGLANTGIYVGVGKLLLSLGVAHSVTGAFALLCASASGFALHRWFSFRSGNRGQDDLVRFAALVAANTAVSSIGLPALTLAAGLSDTISLLLLSSAIPVSNFLAMRFWVFRPRAANDAA